MCRVPVLASGRVAMVVENGGRSRRSSPLTTSATPSSARAREQSTETIRAWACGLRQKATCSVPGGSMSSR